MSKSILLSQSMKKATTEETYLDLGDDILNTLWPVVQKSSSTYPNLWRIIEDMYGDFKVNSSDLQALSEEIQKLKASFADQAKIVIWLEVLRTLSTAGKQLNLAMYGIAD